MSDNCPADNNADLTNTVKDTMAHLTTVESHLEVQTKINNKLQAENYYLKTGMAKQEEKDIKHKERNDKLGSLVDEHKAKLEGHATMIPWLPMRLLPSRTPSPPSRPTPPPPLPNPPPP